MQREVDIEDIWDGRFYGPDDRVKIGCQECAGCSDCCRTTGDSIVLDPWDMYMLEKATGRNFEEMIEHEIEIRLVDGMILPNIMEHREGRPETEDACGFLDGQGRCSIHEYRPGFCRLFPLGRLYVDETESGNGETGEERAAKGTGRKTEGRKDAGYKAGLSAFSERGKERYFRYFVQRKECTKKDSPRYKVKLRDWLGIQDLAKYEDYIVRWHFFLKDVGGKLTLLKEGARDPIARYVLQMFYVAPYNTDMNFYAQFEARLARARMVLAPMGV